MFDKSSRPCELVGPRAPSCPRRAASGVVTVTITPQQLALWGAFFSETGITAERSNSAVESGRRKTNDGDANG